MSEDKTKKDVEIAINESADRKDTFEVREAVDGNRQFRPEKISGIDPWPDPKEKKKG